jgi:sulfatase maturation enzyme AslB (radical SAM superfamily)
MIKRLSIEPTSYCNLNCIFCAKEHRKDNGIMNYDFFCDIVNQAIDCGIKQFALTPMIGELFMDKGIFKKIEYLEKKEVDYFFFTNFTLIGIPEILKLKELKHLLKIYYSVYGESLEAFKFLTRGKESEFNNIVNSLEYIINKTPELADKILFIMKFLHIDFYKKFMHSDFTKLLYRYKVRGNLLAQLYNLDIWDGFVPPSRISSKLSVLDDFIERPCEQMPLSQIVLWNGRYNLCGCRDVREKFHIANLKEVPFKDCYEGDIYNEKLENSVEICGQCTMMCNKGIFV